MTSPEVISEVIPLIEEAYFVKDFKDEQKKPYGITVTSLHKCLFKLKKELPNNEHIQEILPYYWYRHGPYSEVVLHTISHMLANGLLIKEQNVLHLNREKVTQDLYLDKDVRRGFKSALKHFNPYKPAPFVDAIYEDYAPCPFITAYKLDFRKTVESYILNLTSGEIPLDNFSDTSILRDCIFEWETELPIHPLFDRFNTLFSSFSTDALRVFKYLKQVNKDVILLNKVLKMAEDNIWETFAYGIRIVKHDPYPPYDTEFNRWNDTYNTSLAELTSQIRAFRSDILSTIRGTLHYEQDKKSQEFLSTVMQGYLSKNSI
jgi:hypothetical protein